MLRVAAAAGVSVLQWEMSLDPVQVREPESESVGQRAVGGLVALGA